jgi:hypothetical protein
VYPSGCLMSRFWDMGFHDCDACRQLTKQKRIYLLETLAETDAF